jgi:hemin uptake protein HemP
MIDKRVNVDGLNSADIPSRRDNPPLDVRQLLGDRDEVRLLHAGQEYRLRITRNGKLILTK